MNDITQDEINLIAIIRTLKPFEVVELKLNDSGEVIYTYTRKDRHLVS